MQTSRRHFLQTALATGTGLALTAGAGAIEPIKRSGKPLTRLSICAYSYRQYLTSKKKDEKPAMTMHDFIDTVAGMRLDAVELTQYYFAETTPEYLNGLKLHCSRLGLDVSGTAVGNNFCVSDPEKLKAQLAMVKEWIEHSSRLGAKTMRIFAGKVEKDDPEEKVRERVIESISAACEHAAKYGIILALENHGDLTSTADQVLAIVKAVKSDNFGVNLDTGNFHSDDPYEELAKVAPYAVTAHLKVEIQRGKQKAEETDFAKIFAMLRTAGYRGYGSLEYEAAEDPKTAVPRAVETIRKAMDA
jgi:sugar phosphate isomerase/epimerase